MKRLIRILVVIVVILILLLVAVPFLVPVDKFRPTIEEKASQALGRKVELGNLSLSLLSGSLSAEKLSIGDDPSSASRHSLPRSLLRSASNSCPSSSTRRSTSRASPFRIPK